MTTTAISVPSVAEAEQALTDAQRHLEELRTRRVEGGPVTQAEYASAVAGVEYARDGVEAARKAEERRHEATQQEALDGLERRLQELDDAALEKARAAASRALGAYVDAMQGREAVLREVMDGIVNLGSPGHGKAQYDPQGITVNGTHVDLVRPETRLFRLVRGALEERGGRVALHWNPQD